ncbi:isochorismate synthase [Bacillus atrophaeus]|uniref:isochorismate synthase DhbC n=1 Tax=Bacillus atrophaeus TaxID=1452 RepID=UPI000D044120|nr:isochorismate synthase DhbC [Bacillus atrophaeus]PRR96605.1 isochorismate synthase [Bacillus atrophaeus]
MSEHHVISEEKAEQLLSQYRAGSFFLSTPHRTLLAEGAFAEVPNRDGHEDQLKDLPERIAAVLNEAKECGHSNPAVAGAIPFDYTKPAKLIVPMNIRWSGPLQLDPAGRHQQPPENTYEMQPIPEPAEYMRGVERGLERIEAGDLSKIVLSRSLQLTSPKPIHIESLLHHLAQHNTNGYTFAADVSKQETDSADLGASPSRRTLIGASPELLVSRSGTRVVSNPLAGSRPRSKDPVEDQRRAAELLSSAKDLHEHEVVADAVAAALRPFCRTLDVPAEPSLVQTETMWHLSSEIRGELSDPSTSALDLAIALHPTPAVCGTPTDSAREAIKEIEPFDRGFFTGMVGWCDSEGDGDWVVTIRCAEAEDYALRLFAGAGVVKGSKAEDELAETSAKFRTMLLAMGLKNELLKSLLEG